MTKTFKITIGILILLALAAGGVLGISRSKQPSSALTGQGTPSSAPSARFGGQAVDKEEGNEEVEEITAGDIDTSNWKTYRNEEYGFELKYPGEWEIRDITSVNKPINKSLSVLYAGAPKTLTFDSLFQIQIVFMDIDKKIDELKQLPETGNNEKRMFSDWITILGKKPINISGKI